MGNIRDFVNKSPWIGWIFAGLILIVAVYLFFRTPSNESPYSPERMREMVSIKFTDTGEVIQMSRGDLDRTLRRRGEKVDAAQGIINPKTNQPTGFLYNKDEWDKMIARINTEKDEIKKSTSMNVAPVARTDIPKMPDQPKPADTTTPPSAPTPK